MAFESGKTYYDINRQMIEEHVASGSGALAETLSLTEDLRIISVRLHLTSPATQESFVVSVDSAKGVNFDITLFSTPMGVDADGVPGALTDVVWSPDTDEFVDGADSLLFNWTNTDACTWGLSVLVARRV